MKPLLVVIFLSIRSDLAAAGASVGILFMGLFYYFLICAAPGLPSTSKVIESAV